MKIGLVRKLCFVMLCFFGCQKADAQQYRQLSMDDFHGSPEHNGSTVAFTHCYINLKYDVHAREGNYQLVFYVTLEMNKNLSWIDQSRISSTEMLAEVMKHEQGHYTIAYFEQQELLRAFSRTHFGEDYKDVVKEIFDRIHAKYEQLTRDYDDDTNHSLNRAQQESWDKYFQKRLKHMPPLNS